MDYVRKEEVQVKYVPTRDGCGYNDRKPSRVEVSPYGDEIGDAVIGVRSKGV